MAEELRSTINDRETERDILADANAGAPLGEDLQADYEHGQWWVTDLATGAQWNVVDVREGGREYFDFEQVTEGEVR